MTYLKRVLNLPDLLKKKSFFLFGSRSTGKTSLINAQLSDRVLLIDLLDSDVYLTLSAKPAQLASMIAAQRRQDRSYPYIVIDEIQKIPMLLDEIHRLIEKEKVTFLLTGSSARKLKQQGVNLLAGRAWRADLFPLTYQEIPEFDLARYLLFGGLPQVYLSDYPREELKAYVNTYLKEEIQAEAIARNLQSFSRFLQASAVHSGQITNFASISNDIAVPASTVREYYFVLEDTLVGFLLPPWQKSVKRKPISTGKFFFFDVGVKHQLMRVKSLPEQSDLMGQAFEHFIAMELRAYLSYTRQDELLSFWQSTSGHEVDFIIGDTSAIEVKLTQRPSKKHLKGLRALQEERICQTFLLVCQTPHAEEIDGILILPWQQFLQQLWQGVYVS